MSHIGNQIDYNLPQTGFLEEGEAYFLAIEETGPEC